MNDLRTAAQQALDYWEQVAWGDAVMADKMDALRAALAQQAEPVASRGWLFRRNADGTIGIFAPPPKPGESQRTSDCVGPNNRDLHELLGKLADHMAAPPQQAEPAQDPDELGENYKLALAASIRGVTIVMQKTTIRSLTEQRAELARACRMALRAIEQGAPFDYLDNVVAPELRRATEGIDE